MAKIVLKRKKSDKDTYLVRNVKSAYGELEYDDSLLEEDQVVEPIEKTNEEKVDKLINKINELKDAIGIKKSIKEYGIDEKDFLNRLDEMVEQAFDDQCTGANPRYPLMSEIKEMYLNAYYGKGDK